MQNHAERFLTYVQEGHRTTLSVSSKGMVVWVHQKRKPLNITVAGEHVGRSKNEETGRLYFR